MINNLPIYVKSYKYVIVREFDDEYWYYGADNDENNANETALAIGGYVFETADL